MPTKSVPRMTDITARVVAALRASGGLKAGTPVAMASVPVRPTEPAEKARTASSTSARLLMSAVALGERGVGCVRRRRR